MVRQTIIQFVFYSNYFYGLCAVALSVEASLQQRVPLNGAFYFFLVFIITVLYYSYPYIRKAPPANRDPRAKWYYRHYRFMFWNQVIITVILAVTLVWFLYSYSNVIWNMSAVEWLVLLAFPVVAASYYGLSFLSAPYSLRSMGWLKPFVIGFTWAGLVTVYPVLFYNILHNIPYIPGLAGAMLFVKNFMFIAVLCIIFDVKDYNVDYINRLRTFVVKLGLRKTVFYVVTPLAFLGLATFLYYAIINHFHPVKMVLNVIPIALLVVVALSLRRRRSLLYYLAVVDGLMLVKAVCGIIAMKYF